MPEPHNQFYSDSPLAPLNSPSFTHVSAAWRLELEFGHYPQEPIDNLICRYPPTVFHDNTLCHMGSDPHPDTALKFLPVCNTTVNLALADSDKIQYVSLSDPCRISICIILDLLVQGYPEANYDAQNPDGSGSLNLNVSVRSDNYTALAREIASASVVLLKNTARTLPLRLSALKTVAIVGLDAIMPDVECGDSNENLWGSGSNLLDFTDFALESSILGPAAATGADMAIVFGNAMSGELGFYQSVNGNEGDWNDLELWFSGSTLLKYPNTAVVVYSVGPVDMSAFASNPNVTVIVYARVPGEQTAPGLVHVLTGIVNASGRLPFSIADVDSDYNSTIVTDPGFPLGFPVIDHTETLFLDYRSMDAAGITPRYD
ncbi:glycoside hydrolase family 3 C-terminal domain-containing protein [Roridomyces roridus]|uniref:beta-glucosidase n=1 Tax=Roridomyces roridus TaxID=1738132 RepID=A0AAD7B2R9_9AGAR|nr:glycoside hydrolase family 3 C-terminal domain-containing protein [Roridomyces roridus]